MKKTPNPGKEKEKISLAASLHGDQTLGEKKKEKEKKKKKEKRKRKEKRKKKEDEKKKVTA